MSELQKLLDAGYTVTLEPDYEGSEAPQPRYWAHVEKIGLPSTIRTAEGATPELAIWTASPLHGDDEPLPAGPCPTFHPQDGMRCERDRGHIGSHSYLPFAGGGTPVFWLGARCPEMNPIISNMRCLKDAGHDGDHRSASPGGTLGWLSGDEPAQTGEPLD